MINEKTGEGKIKPVEFLKQVLKTGRIVWKPSVYYSDNTLGDVRLETCGLPTPSITAFTGTIANAEITIKLDYLSGGRGPGGAWGLGKGRRIKRGNWISYPGSLSLSFDGKEVFYGEVGFFKNRILYGKFLESAQKSLSKSGR